MRLFIFKLLISLVVETFACSYSTVGCYCDTCTRTVGAYSESGKRFHYSRNASKSEKEKLSCAASCNIQKRCDTPPFSTFQFELPMQRRNTQLRQFPADISCCQSFHIFQRSKSMKISEPLEYKTKGIFEWRQGKRLNFGFTPCFCFVLFYFNFWQMLGHSGAAVSKHSKP
ncbi:hypothetical protein Tsp_13573 [Trichinella spiralis]|uniref:hypothetical protein n=1 Tax=Trichinella spiralis TaxID=6334 RepID=UPI0001EFEF91|nr:hypothetical protein Tsp_13573 [Trichinella spiralis]